MQEPRASVVLPSGDARITRSGEVRPTLETMALDLIAELGCSKESMTTNAAEAIDMSPTALAGRLEQARALYKLMLYLGQARILGPVDPHAAKPVSR
jgi:hypothetical protein